LKEHLQPEMKSFPSAPQAAFLLLAWFVLQYLIGTALYDFRHALDVTSEELGVLAMLLAHAILITAAMHIRGMSYRDLLHPSKASPVGTFVLLVPPVLLLIPLIVLLDVSLIGGIEALLPFSAAEQQAFAGMLAPSLPALFMTCIMAPVMEEMLFRGILLRSFLDQYPRGLAIGYSALYFGAAHLNIYQFALGFLLGGLIGVLYERSRSLIPCMAMHAALNCSVYVWANSQGPSASVTAFDVSPLGWLAALVAATMGLVALRRLLGSANHSQ
jgi:membrane protease YdiL (CAAX protease family)